MTSTAPGTVMVTSTIGIALSLTASAANRASSAVDTRIAGMIPISTIRARISSLVIRSFWYNGSANGRLGRGSKQVPRSHRLAKLLQCSQVSGHRLAVGQLGGAISPLGVQEIEKRQGATPVCVFADIAAPLSHIEIGGFQELGYLRALLQAFVCVFHVRQHLPVGRFPLFLGLPNGDACLRNVALVPVENRQRNTERPAGGTDAIDVRIIGRDGRILLPIGLGERILAVGGGNSQYRRAQIRTILEGLRLQFVERDQQRFVFEFARDVVSGGHRLVTQLLPKIRQRL